jgi:DNA mismatch repair ATPase MutS
MKALLMHRDRDFDVRQPLPWNAESLMQDLALETLLRAIARGDKLVRDVALRALLTGWRNDLETILYRQAIVRDCLDNPMVLREIYDLTGEAIENERRRFFAFRGHYPSSVLYGAIETMQMDVGTLRRLRDMAREQAGRFSSSGFRTLFAMLERELTDEYLAGIEAHLAALKFRRGVLVSAELGSGNMGRDYVLHHRRENDKHWLQRMFARRRPGYTFRLPDRDEAGARALSELRDRGIHLVANALAQSADHITGFFQMLRTELAFYVGCLNLHEQLTALGAPTCFPLPLPVGRRRLRCQEMYDPCLALQMQRSVVGNTIEADGKNLVVITGANQGGKSSSYAASVWRN